MINVILLCLVAVASANASVVPKSYLNTCGTTNCRNALTQCGVCYGVDQCKKCIIDYNIECTVCAVDIFSEPSITTGGTTYPMICDATQAFQVSACKIKCRGDWYVNGSCMKVGAIPVCQCSTSN